MFFMRYDVSELMIPPKSCWFVWECLVHLLNFVNAPLLHGVLLTGYCYFCRIFRRLWFAMITLSCLVWLSPLIRLFLEELAILTSCSYIRDCAASSAQLFCGLAF